MSTPQIPMPAMNSQVEATTSTSSKAKETRKPIHHHKGMLGRNTLPPISLLSDVSVMPGRITGSSSECSTFTVIWARRSPHPLRRPGESRDPLVRSRVAERWIPAFAGTPVLEASSSVRGGSCLVTRLDCRVGVADQRLIAGPRPGVEFGQQNIIERTPLAFRDFALQIVAVAERDRLGRAALLAG